MLLAVSCQWLRGSIGRSSTKTNAGSWRGIRPGHGEGIPINTVGQQVNQFSINTNRADQQNPIAIVSVRDGDQLSQSCEFREQISHRHAHHLRVCQSGHDTQQSLVALGYRPAGTVAQPVQQVLRCRCNKIASRDQLLSGMCRLTEQVDGLRVRRNTRGPPRLEDRFEQMHQLRHRMPAERGSPSLHRMRLAKQRMHDFGLGRSHIDSTQTCLHRAQIRERLIQKQCVRQHQQSDSNGWRCR